LAQENFPSLVEGTETLRNGEYSENIEAATLVYADTEVLNSELIVNGLRLRGEVKVTLDLNKSLALLRDLKLKKKLKKEVDALVAEMANLMKGDVGDLDMITLQNLRIDVEVALLMGGDLQAAEKAVQLRIEGVLSERVELMKIWASNAKWEVTKVNPKDDTLHINVSVPDMQKQYEALVGKYDKDIFPSVVEGAVCGLSKAGVHFMIDAFPVAGNRTMKDRKQRDKRVAKEVRFKFNHYGRDADVEMFNSSFKVMPCF
jgi:hypothetical protein